MDLQSLLKAFAQHRGAEPNPLAQALAMADNAPVGSVGAPGGINPVQPSYGKAGHDPVMSVLGAVSYLPGIGGDIAGPAADARMFQTRPESRTLTNAGLFALGLLPAVPSLAYMMSRKVTNAPRMARALKSQAGMTGYHGSPHTFDEFDYSKIGTGEGAQAYGHGLYFAENPEVAKEYKRLFSEGAYSEPRVAYRGIDFPAKDYDFAAATMPGGTQMAAANGNPVPVRVASSATPAQFKELFPHLSSVEAGALSTLHASGNLERAINTLEKRKNIEGADFLRKATPELSFSRSQGNLYHVDIPDEHIDKMLDWDKPLSEQPANVQKLMREHPKLNTTLRGPFSYREAQGKAYAVDARGEWSNPFGSISEAQEATKGGTLKVPKHFDSNSGRDLYQAMADEIGQAEASRVLREMGIPGIKYLDQGSRGAEKQTSNFVVFDDKIPKILKRE